MKFLAIAAAAATLLAGAASAATQVADGSFETQGSSVASYCYFGAGGCSAGAWSGLNGGGLQDETNGAWPGAATPAGSKYAFVQIAGYIEQTFQALNSGAFQLSWLSAGRPSGCCGGNQSYDVLLNGSAIGNASTTTNQAFQAEISSVFVLTSGSYYTLRFQGLTSYLVNGDNTSFIDNVSLTAVPEPTSWGLMILGFGGIGAAIRNRRRMFAAA